MRRSRWAALLLLAGCSFDHSTYGVPTRDARALVLLEIAGGAVVSARALDLAEGATYYSIPRDPDGARAGVALYYGCSLTELGLPAGELTVSPDERARALPQTRAVATARLDREAPEWTPSRLPPELARARFELPPRDACTAVTTGRLTLPRTSTTPPTFAVAIDDHALLVGLLDRRLFRVDLAGTVEPLPPLVTRGTQASPVVAAARSSTGALYLLSTGGGLIRGTPDQGWWRLERLRATTTSAAPSNPARWAWIALAEEDIGADQGSPELFALTDYQTVAHYRPSTDRAVREWTELRRTEGRSISDAGGIAWLGPQEALAVRAFDGDAQVQPIDRVDASGLDPSRALTSVATIRDVGFGTVMRRIPGIGVVVGTSRGHLLRYESQAMVPMEGSTLGQRVRALASFEDGLVASGEDGTLARYREGAFCDASPSLVRGAAVVLLERVGDELMAVAVDAAGGRDVEIITLRRTAPCARGPL